MELNQNPTSGEELGVMLPTDSSASWFAIFEFEPNGYVKDDEKNHLDADKILASIRAGNDRANEERKKRGWGSVDIVGWYKPPAYDPVTHNLEWSIRRAAGEHRVVNHATR